MNNVLLVIAHPDDESMFFLPTLRALQHSDLALYLLCLSTGNAYGSGCRRKQELLRVCTWLQIPADHVSILDHPQLQVLTFDQEGISHHANHIAVYRGVLAAALDAPHIRLLLLETVPTWRKFLGVWDALCIAARLLMHKTPTPSSSTTAAAVGINAPPSHHPNDQHTSPCLHVPLEHIVSSAHGGWHQKNTKAVCFMMQPWSNLTAMWMHTSQFVWYRILFVIFSRYTYVNTLLLLGDQRTLR